MLSPEPEPTGAAPDASPSGADTDHGRGTFSRRQVLGLASLAVVGTLVSPGVAAAQPSAAQPPAAQARTYTPTFLRFAFSGDPSADGTERWKWQGLQGDVRRPSRTAVPDQFVYATAVQRPSDPAGITQCLRPGNVRDEWLLRDAADRVISRTRGASGREYALDVGHPELRAAVARFLVEKCRRDAWTGVVLDEVNAEFQWGFPDSEPVRYPTPESYQAAVLGLVQVLATALRDAGFTLAGNLGSAVAHARPFCQATVAAGMIPISEFFVAGYPGVAPASIENGRWQEQTSWAQWSLDHAPRTLLHDHQSVEDLIGYGLGTFLLLDNGTGVYGADIGYSARTTFHGCFADALQLGNPAGPSVRLGAGLFRRDFANGQVVVNASERPQDYGSHHLPGTSSLLLLGAPTAPAPAGVPTDADPRAGSVPAGRAPTATHGALPPPAPEVVPPSYSQVSPPVLVPPALAMGVVRGAAWSRRAAGWLRGCRGLLHWWRR